jgi:hypothetical protein
MGRVTVGVEPDRFAPWSALGCVQVTPTNVNGRIEGRA